MNEMLGWKPAFGQIHTSMFFCLVNTNLAWTKYHHDLHSRKLDEKIKNKNKLYRLKKKKIIRRNNKNLHDYGRVIYDNNFARFSFYSLFGFVRWYDRRTKVSRNKMKYLLVSELKYDNIRYRCCVQQDTREWWCCAYFSFPALRFGPLY